MTTKFPQLPVLGHMPKKRKENLDKVLTLRQLYAILDSDWLLQMLIDQRLDDGSDQEEYILQRLRTEFKAASRRAPGVGEPK